MDSSRPLHLHAGRKVTIDHAFDIDPNHPELICLVGAGGKTTTLFNMARELKRLKKRVLVTTTTAIYYPDEKNCDEVIINRSHDPEIFSRVAEGTVIGCGKELFDEGKLRGIDKKFIENIYEDTVFDYILVEGDGSKQKPIKAPALHEPVIPGNTTKIIGVIGLDALGRKIENKWVHRPEMFCKVTGTREGAIIDEETVARLIVSPEGLFKSVPDECQKYLLLNKAEDTTRKRSAMNIIALVKKSDSTITGFLVANMIGKNIDRIG